MNCICECADITGWRQAPSLPILDNLSERRQITEDNRQTGTHRFERLQRRDQSRHLHIRPTDNEYIDEVEEGRDLGMRYRPYDMRILSDTEVLTVVDEVSLAGLGREYE